MTYPITGDAIAFSQRYFSVVILGVHLNPATLVTPPVRYSHVKFCCKERRATGYIGNGMENILQKEKLDDDT